MTKVDDMKAYRVEHQCSLQEARFAINKRDKIERLTRMLGECRRVDASQLRYIVADVIEEILLEASAS